MLYKSRKLFRKSLYASIINNVKETEQFYEFINSDDAVVERAIKVLVEGKAFPEAPQKAPSKIKIKIYRKLWHPAIP